MDGHTKAAHVASYLFVPDDRQLFRWSGGHRTWDHVRLRVAHLVAKLSAQINVGDRVCTLALTTADHLEVLLAITAAGGIAAPLNWRWSRQEVEYAVRLLGAKLLIADDHCWRLASSVGGQRLPPLTKLSSMIPARLPSTTLHFFTLQQPPDASAFIIFTSGTTGPARAAVLTHDALDFQCRQKQLVCGYHRGDVYLHTSPLFHVGGLCSALAMLRAGATHVFFPPPSAPTFSASMTLQTIQTHNVTSFIAVPTMIVDMIGCAIGKRQSQKQALSISSVTTILVGAGGLSDRHVASLSHLFPNAALWSAYGMTECCSSITFARLPIHSSIARNALDASMVYVGTPPAGIEIKISGQPSVQQRDLGAEGIGEILTRGPHVMLRYWNDADHDDTRHDVFDMTSGDGSPWLRTGDMGWMDPMMGHVWLVGRIKDVIKSGGENVPAARVERTLMSHPSVAAAAAVGLPDPRLGERVAAAVVLAQNGLTWCGENIQIVSDHTVRSCTQSCVDGKLLQDHCRSVGLPGFMVPRVFLCLKELPINSTGKVIKSRVRDVMVSALAQRYSPSKL